MFRFLRKKQTESSGEHSSRSRRSNRSPSRSQRSARTSASSEEKTAERNGGLPSSPVSSLTERQYHTARLSEVVALTTSDDVKGLKAFNSCIEASDALASTSTPPGRDADSSTGLSDCSVLVSADGDLLIVPTQQNDASKTAQEGAQKWCWKQNCELGEEYESAVFVGNDLPDIGDKGMNGFSAKGWSVVAASLALKQSADSMGDLAHFLEELVATKTSISEKDTKTIQNLQNMGGDMKASQVTEYEKYLQDNFATEDLQRGKQQRNYFFRNNQESNVPLKVAPDRVGPLHHSDSTIAATLKALENYYSSVAESESKVWKTMTERSGGLAKLRKAKMTTEHRLVGRQTALQETMSRIKTMESHLRECKSDAKMKWKKVHETEVIVTRLVEEKIMEHNMLKEEERRKKMEEEFGRSIGERSATFASNLLDFVSEATASMEEGSFTPVESGGSNNLSPLNDEETPISPDTFAPPEDMEFEMDSRYEFEVMYRLPELRIQALAADRAAKEAATSLLSILSAWDTTSRSAQVAAETCLVSSGTEQASCIRSIIAMERESIEERLKLLEKLESVADAIDVRADMDQYITADRMKQGRRSYRGEHDDGGIASALNRLNEEDLLDEDRDGQNEEKCCGEDSDTEELDDHASITTELIEENLECFFRSDSVTENDLEASVTKLCAIGKAKSSKYNARRSTICYSMNAKRSTNAQISSLDRFGGLCKVFDAVLSGCNVNQDSAVSTAILLLGLSDHFYVLEGEKKIFVKSRLVGHSLWDNDSFWDRALEKAIKEKLNYSDVLSNFQRETHEKVDNKEKSEWTETPKTRWHDLNVTERCQAATQVNAVIFEQVSAMTDSMLELRGNPGKTSAFVRRVCVKNQLPMSQRTALLKHLTKQK